MKTFDITTKIYIFKVKELKDMKDTILSLIESVEGLPFRDNCQSLSNTDWNLDNSHHRPYVDTVANAIIAEVNEGSPILPDELYIKNMWFQQYNADDFHDWHTHGDCMFSSVYYLELPDKTQTSFLIDGKEVQLDVEEGDFVVFPNCIPHCSKPNTTGERKTVIALNLNTVY